MKIESITIRHFRSIRNVTIPLDDLTVLIGPNGAGKTTVLEALSLFGEGKADVTGEDFYPESEEIRIILSIRTEGHSAFPREFVIKGVCEIEKRFKLDAEGKVTPETLFATMRNSDFLDIRSKKVEEMKSEIERLKDKYGDLPKIAPKEKWITKFDEWEYNRSIDPKIRGEHELCYVKSTKNKINLNEVMAVTYIPAMKDITADGREGTNSLLTELMRLAIWSAKQNNKKFEKVLDSYTRAEQRYEKSLNRPLKKLNKELQESAKRYMDKALLKIGLEPPSYSPTQPNASIRLQDNGFPAQIERAGSGFQRVYLLSLLDTIAAMRRNNKLVEKDSKSTEDSIQEPILRLIIIDEPELYQHPQRQRRILKAFIDLVDEFPIRVVCSTHSPYFIELRKIDSLRLLQKDESARVLSTTIDKLKTHIITEKKADVEKARTWLDMNATHWVTEGFFSKLVVIVEGPGDRNMLLATAHAMDIDLDKYEISIVSGDGKGTILKFAHIFKQFQIPMYLY